MELRTFVKEVLVPIAGGITDAQEELSPRGTTIINPGLQAGGIPVGTITAIKDDSDDKWIPVQEVRFDVAITVEQNKEGSKGGRLTVPFSWIGLGAEGTVTETNAAASTSRIQFAVNVRFPRGWRPAAKVSSGGVAKIPS